MGVIPQLVIEAEAQAGHEGWGEDDVRQGGQGGGQAREEGGQGLPRQGPEGLHLRAARRRVAAKKTMAAGTIVKTWSCHGGARGRVRILAWCASQLGGRCTH